MKKTISGIRGIFGEELNLNDISQFCTNFSSVIKSQKCVIGKDTRPSSPAIKDTASSTLMRNGIDIFSLGTAPTPVIFREARRYGAGLVISASHNPIIWNGMKFIIDGRGINEEELFQIIKNQEVLESKPGITHEMTSSYIAEAEKIIGNLENRPNIAIDVGGGAAKGFASELLEKIGCNVKVLNEKLEGCTRGPDPVSDVLEDLVLESNKKEIGFAFDLDGDRLVIVKDGEKQSSDVTLGLGIAKSLEMGCKRFVLSTDTSISIEKFIKEKKGTVQRSKVGEANVIDLMLKTDAQAGGEGSSGGFIFPEFNYCRDGILTSGLVASMLKTPEFDDILNYMKNYFQIREKTTIPSEFHDKVIEEMHAKISKEYSETNMLDGIRYVIDEDDWVLIRKSNTEDIIRVSAESKDKERCKKIVRETLEIVKQSYDKVR